jgi:ubiquinone/menaquinone biosynthesis C-methylase UbiE
MGLKQKTMRAMVRQFRRPHGMGGRAAGWVMAHRESNRKRNVWAVGLLDVQPDDRVLEIGFGPGIAIEELARRATSGRVVGVDHSEVMVRQASRRNAAAVRDGRVELRLGNAEDLPEFDGPFDKMLAVNSLMFWDDPVARLKQLRGLLVPGGRIAIVFQPRAPGSTDETAARTGQEIAAHYATAGFTDVRVETLALKPTAVVCVLGVSPGP